MQGVWDENVMWQAAVSCDSKFDALFFYAVKTTGIYCRPSCRSKAPKRENIRFFADADEAENAGYRPCKRCRPDSEGGTPEAEIIQEVKRVIHGGFRSPLPLREIAGQTGVSRYHLNRLFKKFTGETPREYLQKIRVDHAVHLILTTDWDIMRISLESGFQSLSNFYSAFHKQTGTTPTMMRKAGPENVALC
jgi:AraC family transcriptional regulator of adaptative response / methylphosphotriester-DNA alkyltransferase methyltransferase